MLRRPHYIALGTVVVLILLILNLPTHTSARLKLAIGSLFLPLFGLANSSQQLAGTASDALTTRAELLRQNQTLRRENEQLPAAGHADSTRPRAKMPGSANSSAGSKQTGGMSNSPRSCSATPPIGGAPYRSTAAAATESAPISRS